MLQVIQPSQHFVLREFQLDKFDQNDLDGFLEQPRQLDPLQFLRDRENLNVFYV